MKTLRSWYPAGEQTPDARDASGIPACSLAMKQVDSEFHWVKSFPVPSDIGRCEPDLSSWGEHDRRTAIEMKHVPCHRMRPKLKSLAAFVERVVSRNDKWAQMKTPLVGVHDDDHVSYK